MNKDELRSEVTRLMKADTEQDVNDMLSIYQQCLFKIFLNHPKKQEDIGSTVDAKIVIQMMFTKISHIKQLIQGLEFTSNEGDKMNPIIDPTVIAASVRTIFETVGTFNAIYVKAQTEEERSILYTLWVIAGLKYRQRFVNTQSSAVNVKKAAEEKQQIDDLISSIEKTNKFIGLSVIDKDKIYKCIADKSYTIRFEGSNVKFLNGYQDLVEKAGIRDEVMGKMYTYFSLYSHPSNVAVFQFASMFAVENPNFFIMTAFNLKLAFMLTSVFIADYIKTFPETSQIFNSLSVRDQCVINSYNIFARDSSYSINDEYYKLN